MCHVRVLVVFFEWVLLLCLLLASAFELLG